MPLPKNSFDVKRFLADIGEGRRLVRNQKKDRVYALFQILQLPQPI